MESHQPPSFTSPFTQSANSKPPKSPPLAFEKTSNDALAPLISPEVQLDPLDPLSPPSAADMGVSQLANGGEVGALQRVVEKQAGAIKALHVAFDAERDAWIAERDSLHQRIGSLEKLLTAGNSHSPAKSPTISPTAGDITSPNSRASGSAQRLPSIAEDESAQTLSSRRGAAPVTVELDPIAEYSDVGRLRYNSVVGFEGDGGLKVEEIPFPAARILSPLPPELRANAGATPPPRNPLKNRLDGLEDTPTRTNTLLNASLSRDSDDEDGDQALSGPLNMPELPNRPGEHNFTEEMLCKRLERIAASPDCEDSKPMVFAEPSPGLMTPADLAEQEKAEKEKEGSYFPVAGEEAPLAPVQTAIPPASTLPEPQSLTSTHSSSLHSSALMSPQSGIPLSQIPSKEQEARERAVHRDFQEGGIKLKKKPSSNFGAPFGSLGGFGNVRRAS